MWCANCRSDVAAEVSPDNRLVHCAICGGHIATPLSSRALSRTQQARELLERWSRDRTHDPDAIVPPPHADRLPKTLPQTVHARSVEAPRQQQNPISSNVEPPQEVKSQPARPSGEFRIDAGREKSSDATPKAPRKPEPQPDGNIAANSGCNETEDGEIPRQAINSAPQQRRDAGHAIAGPHAAFATKTDLDAKPPLKWVPLVGQSLAYSGVLGLMLGTCLVILGYFRGPATYAPTGWLITMAGQMLLFLGVVTLVSSGMEETTSTVADRIDRLNEKLLRIEESTDVLRGPRAELRDQSHEMQPESKAG